MNQANLLKERNKKIDTADIKVFVNNLNKIGYIKNSNDKKNNNLKLIVKAFQRRFRKELINGLIDRECALICKNLVKKFI